VDSLFKTLCDCALLNPDPEGGKFFENMKNVRYSLPNALQGVAAFQS
jgi:hypothetical protein